MHKSLLGSSLLAVALSFGFAPLAHAQDQPRGDEGERPRRRPSMVDQLKDRLGLTDEQVAKVKALEEQLRGDMQKLRDELEGDRDALREKMRPLFEKLRGQVRDLLTKEQQEKFDAWSKEQDARRGARGPRREGERPQGGDEAPKADAVAPGKAKEIALGTAGGFDYLLADAESRRLYVSHATKLDVIDMDKDEKVGEVEGVEGAHGTAIVHDLKRGFATAGRKQKVIVFDLETNKVVKEVPTGQGPDAILSVTSTGEVWSMNHRAGTITCIDARTLEVTSTIEVGGALEFAVEDAANGVVYVNVEDKSTLVAIDAKKHAVTTTRQVTPGAEPAGLAFDPKSGYLFVGCGNQKLVVMEAASGKVVASFDIGQHCDACAFDPATSTVYASCADGTTSVVHVDAGKLVLGPQVTTVRGGKTCAVDAKTHKLYVAAGPRRNEPGEAKVLIFATSAAAPAPATPAPATPAPSAPSAKKYY